MECACLEALFWLEGRVWMAWSSANGLGLQGLRGSRGPGVSLEQIQSLSQGCSTKVLPRKVWLLFSFCWVPEMIRFSFSEALVRHQSLVQHNGALQHTMAVAKSGGKEASLVLGKRVQFWVVRNELIRILEMIDSCFPRFHLEIRFGWFWTEYQKQIIRQKRGSGCLDFWFCDDHS